MALICQAAAPPTLRGLPRPEIRRSSCMHRGICRQVIRHRFQPCQRSDTSSPSSVGHPVPKDFPIYGQGPMIRRMGLLKQYQSHAHLLSAPRPQLSSRRATAGSAGRRSVSGRSTRQGRCPVHCAVISRPSKFDVVIAWQATAGRWPTAKRACPKNGQNSLSWSSSKTTEAGVAYLEQMTSRLAPAPCPPITLAAR